MSAGPGSGPGSGFGKALVIITGASRGFGRALALSLAPRLAPGSVLVLSARSEDLLLELKRDLGRGDPGITVRCVVADLGCKAGVERLIAETRDCATDPGIQTLLLANNAASLGDVSRRCRDFTDVCEVDSYLSLNVSSALCVTAGVLRSVPGRSGLTRVVLNVSSLCALRPFPSWVLYCSGKAARDMMFRVLAEEEPDLRVLNYAPGPLDTDMQLQARSSSADDALRNTFSVMHASGQLLTCDQSVSKLVTVLLEDTYPSGAHLDYYDL
ncbi:sepiapterin reductase a [Rhinichthys klamathensis goyatoka]|uniref:sepiapterin reductase a n=1 Tax=Rhinichthys klamathensis goyatoka TaxID=3034132 RepID=UPI0024B5F866|nr:sepiapterin reductase a [Rhinichthys klamathensis goyatoka]